MTVTPLLISFFAIAVFFGFLNGFHDSANIVSAAITSRALPPRTALLLAAAAVLAGPFLFGVAVAKTVGADLLDPTALDLLVVLSGLSAAVVWNIVTWYLGIPSSSSHALIGGLLGAAVLTGGLEVIRSPGLIKVLLALFLSPALGLLAGFFLLRLTLFLLRGASPGVNRLLRRGQVLALVGLGLSHGTNDGQKTMAVLTLGLVTVGWLDEFTVPLWVIAVSGLAMALGTSLGGWRLIRTLGGRIFRIRPAHGFVSQIAGASVILGAAFAGGPVSTTQVMSSAIMGTGAGQRMSQVRWQVLREMLTAWILTIPITAALAGLIHALLISLGVN
ncbi:MAG: inorganic phosphate transporter [Anaerolineales bacterium]|nr:inorganic phosphate transporter [Anaerolineales bacterium]